jgi:hypothetical protein
MKDPRKDPRILKMEREMMFNDTVLRGTTRQIAINFLPEDLDADYWLGLKQDDIVIETIEEYLKKEKQEYLKHTFIDLYRKVGLNLFHMHPQFLNLYQFKVGQATLIKKNLLTMMN